MTDTLLPKNDNSLEEILADFYEKIEEAGQEIAGTPTEAEMENIDDIYSNAKARINALYKARDTKMLEQIENKLLDRSIGLDNEETAVKWDDIVEVLARGESK